MKEEIQNYITQAFKAGVDFGASGRDGSDNSYSAYEKVKENTEYLARKQGINLSPHPIISNIKEITL